MVYVGVDLHRKRSHVLALDPAGEVVLSRRIGNAPTEVLPLFGELPPRPIDGACAPAALLPSFAHLDAEPIEVVFEPPYGWSWFAHLLADAGIPAHIAQPLAT